MGRWTGSWLSGPGSAGLSGPATQRYPGERQGLPEPGKAGAVASTVRRAAAFLLDAVASALVAGLFTYPDLPENYSLAVFAVVYVFFVAAFGQTPAMRLLGLRVVRLDGSSAVGMPRAVVRAALLFLLIPALIWDADSRGLHDKAAGTVVLRV